LFWFHKCPFTVWLFNCFLQLAVSAVEPKHNESSLALARFFLLFKCKNQV